MLALLATIPLAALAEPPPAVPFSGQVKEKGTRLPVAGAEVLLDGGEVHATADAEGRFALPAVAVGKHKIHVRASGYVPADTDETFKPGTRLEATYWVERKQRYVTVVRAQKLVKQTLEQTLDVEEIKKIPGTQGDALKAVQTLPGVARTPFGAGQLIVWGSAPGDTRAYVDGVFIPVLYHFGGLRSTVGSDLIDSLSFTPGAYGPEYGRGMGGIVEVEARRPKSQGFHGDIDLNLIDGSFLLEGPISKNVDFAVSVRRSWIDAFLPLLSTNDFQLSPKYYDYQAEVHVRASPRDDIDFLLFGSRDEVSLLLKNPDPLLQAQFGSTTYFHRLLARWTHRFAGGATLTVTPSVGLDQPMSAAGTVGGNLGFTGDVLTLYGNLRAVAHVPVAPQLRIDAGLDFEASRNAVSIDAPLITGPPAPNTQGPPNIGQYVNDLGVLYFVETAPWIAANFSLFQNRLTVTPGLRFDVYSFVGYQGTPDSYSHTYLNWEPRLQMRYQINKVVALKAAIGAYHQPPPPQMLLARFGAPSLGPSIAFHYVLGVELHPTSTLSVEASGFYKELGDVPSTGISPNQPLFVNDGEGRVYGGELLVRQQMWKHFFGWVSYTLSRAERRDHPGEDWHLFDFDQTHILSLIASYELPWGFQVGVRFRYVTGNPTTPVNSWYWSANDNAYRPINGALNSGRLPAFHQLDLRIDKTWTFKLWKLTLYLDIQNLYNAKNPEAIQYAPRPVDCAVADACQDAISGLPFLPALGIRGDF